MKRILLLMILSLSLLSLVFIANYTAEPAQPSLASQMCLFWGAAFPADLADVSCPESYYLLNADLSGSNAASFTLLIIADNDGSALSTTSSPIGPPRYPLKTQSDIITSRQNYTSNVLRDANGNFGTGSRRYPLKYPYRALGGAV